MHAGSDRAVTQLEAGKAIFDLAGYVSFLLWRSVYVTKQVNALPVFAAKWNPCVPQVRGRRVCHHGTAMHIKNYEPVSCT